MGFSVKALRAELRHAFHGPAWHGPALLEVARSLTAREAAEAPIPGVPSAAAYLLHALAWAEEVTRRVQGGTPAPPARGDWPPVPPLDDASWASLVDEVASVARSLDAALAALPEERLGELVGGAELNPALGTGVRYSTMLLGLAQHNAYHAGQIALLRRALRYGSA